MSNDLNSSLGNTSDNSPDNGIDNSVRNSKHNSTYSNRQDGGEQVINPTPSQTPIQTPTQTEIEIASGREHNFGSDPQLQPNRHSQPEQRSSAQSQLQPELDQLHTFLGFGLETYQVAIDDLMPCKKVPDGVMTTRKYRQIVSSIREIGLIEPVSVLQPDASRPEYILLDGHLRVLAFRELGRDTVPCLLAKDDETYTYNHRINRLSTIQEHYMIRRAIDRGVSRERLARAFNVNLSAINRRINLLDGICPDAVKLLQDHQFTPDVTRVLRNMKAARQVEAVELMIASSTITVAHAEALLKATPPEQRTDVKTSPLEKRAAPIEQIVKLEKEMSQVQESYKDAEENYGSELLNLVVAKGYVTKLLANPAVKSYIARHQPEILTHLELVVNTVSMEEAVQQQMQAESAGLADAADVAKADQGADAHIDEQMEEKVNAAGQRNGKA